MKTPTSSRYPVLENKPIDQWKVTELKEELKRRRLKTVGLKDDLIKRLDEALRAEMDDTTVEAGNDNGMKQTAPENVVSDATNVQSELPVVDVGSVAFVNVEDAMGNAGNVGNAEISVVNVEEVVGAAKENDGNADANVVQSEMDVKVTGKQIGGDAKFDEQQPGLGNDSVFVGEMVPITDVAPVVVGGDVSVEQQSGLGNDPILGGGMIMTPDTAPAVVGDKVSEEQQPGLANVAVLGEEIVTATNAGSVVMNDEVSKGLPSEKAVGGDGLVIDKMEIGNQISGVQDHSEDVTQTHVGLKLDSSDQTNQVSEVSTSLGFPVKSNNFVSTDSLSVFEKNDLKDTFIADNVKLESDVKPEMVLPSSSDLVPDGGKSHPTDVDQPHENKVSVEETDNTVANEDTSQKNFSANLGSAEQLNLDRSSGDDSMEDDALESKQINSNLKFEDVGGKTEKNEITTVEVENTGATAMDTDLPVEKKDLHDQKTDVVTLPDKRKFSDDEPAVNNKPAKRQHRWKKESNITAELPASDIPIASALDVPQSAALKRSFSRSDSSGATDPPKEREVPPSSKPATNSLRIDHFLRPFTLKAVQELLGKTGTVGNFWMDHIKTHCYVTYSSTEEAVETRNAVYNLQWPPNGGRQLVAEFVDPEEVKLRLNPPTPAAPVNSAPTKGPEAVMAPLPSPRQQSLRQQSKLPPPPPPVILNQVPVRERLLPPPPPIEKVDAPIVTLDDLFRKTKATPRIYYLPLSEEEVAARQKNQKQ